MNRAGAPGFRPRFFIAGDRFEPRAAGAGLPAAIEPALGADLPPETELVLAPDDSHHATHVLRLNPGDTCEVVVGAAVYAATVSAVGETVRVQLAARLEEGEGAGASYGVAVGLVQALGRPGVLDTVLEKGTEVGCSFFLFVSADGSPKWADSRREDRLARWRRIVREAAKQSKQVALPEVTLLGSTDEAVGHLRNLGANSVILDPRAGVGLYDALTMLSGCGPPAAVALWVGPEGGWSRAELGRFQTAGIQAAKLGRSVLRTETAGPVAVAVSRLALRDW